MAAAEPQTSALPVTTHLRRLRLGDLSVLGARMGLWPSAREGQSPILAPNTPALLDTEKKNGPTHPNLTSARLPNSLSPKHRGPTLASATGGRSLQCGSRRRCRYPEPNRLCDLACAAGGSLSAHSEASTDRVPQRRPASCPPQPASERASERASSGGVEGADAVDVGRRQGVGGGQGEGRRSSSTARFCS